MRLRIGIFALHLVLCLGQANSNDLFAQMYLARSGARGRTPAVVSENFVVHAADPGLARKVSSEAERFRKELSIQWLGHELPAWHQKCPITVQLGMHAGGETSFAFVPGPSGKGQPIDWQMKIFGPPDRLLDAVLPHEVTHTIFATHFGQPLPRWADEGACTTVEHESERKKNHQMLMGFLSARPSRGLPFNRMFTMRNYPHDILPLYAQGYSLAKFLILQKGRRHFVDYIGSGLQNETHGAELQAWNQATTDFYRYKDLSDLQIAWLNWVREGSSETAFNDQANTPPIALASKESKPSISNPVRSTGKSSSTFVALEPGKTFTSMKSGSWYAQEMERAKGQRVASNQQEPRPTQTRKVSAANQRELVPPELRDSSLPLELRADPRTIWR